MNPNKVTHIDPAISFSFYVNIIQYIHFELNAVRHTEIPWLNIK